MNGRERGKWYPEVVKKQNGEYCVGCRIGLICRRLKEGEKPFVTNILFIDHIDNNPKNNILENMQLLCSACNKIKNPSQKESDSIPSGIKNAEMIRGDIQEKKYRKRIDRTIDKHNWIKVDDAINAGAEHLTTDEITISPVTTKRYLQKLTSLVGNFSVKEDWVCRTIDLQRLTEWLEEIDVHKEILEEKLQAIEKDFEGS